jgi:hypothetical protein
VDPLCKFIAKSLSRFAWRRCPINAPVTEPQRRSLVGNWNTDVSDATSTGVSTVQLSINYVDEDRQGTFWVATGTGFHGHRNKQIAGRLNIAETTVNDHIKNIVEKRRQTIVLTQS